MTHSPPQMCVCDCGCGASFLRSQMVIKTSTRENLYIPHCIDAYQLFIAPQKLRDKLNESGITTHFYALPGEPLADWILIEQNRFRFENYVRYEDPVYGTYFVWEAPISYKISRWVHPVLVHDRDLST